MKKFGNLLNEVKGEKAHREAVAMGLKYKGFGYWVDPSTGETKYKTENDQLVAVDPDVESKMADKTPGPADMAGPGGNPMGAMGTGMQMQQPAGTLPQPGQLPLGAPEPGEEIAPKELDWEPGPDGSTCVDSNNPPAEVPEDSYVTKKNSLQWGAGPDGTNYANIDYAEMIKSLRNPTMDSFLNRQSNMEAIERGKNPSFLSTFMAEAPNMGSAADEARRQGLSYSGYGYWKDSSGAVVAQTQGDKLVMLNQQGGNTAATTDMGNPTGEASGMTPADKARSMGLTSNGSGGYVDQEGNVIARTVNNELVFYDSRAGGGAVSDGSGGAMLTQSSPSWVDPVTGMIIVPPGQPESPVEINSVPDPIPATPPAGYDAFVKRKKLDMYQADAEARRQAEIEAAAKAAEEEATGTKQIVGNQFEDFLGEARRKAAPIKVTRIEPEQNIETPEQKAAKEAEEAKKLRLQPFKGMGSSGATTQQTPAPTPNPEPETPLQQSVQKTEADAEERTPQTTRGPVFTHNVDDAIRDTTDISDATQLEQSHRNGEDKISELGNAVRSSFEERWKTKSRQDKAINDWWNPLERVLQNMEKGDARDKHVATILRGLKSSRRNNKSSKTMSPEQVQALVDRQEKLRDADGSVSGNDEVDIQKVKDFVKGSQTLDVSDDLLEASWNALPPFAKAAMTKGVTDGGFAETDGWKKFLQQGGIDAYTGLPLGIARANWEHVMADTKRSLSDEHADHIDSLDNFVWIDEAVNQRKSNDTFDQFYNSQVDGYDPRTGEAHYLMEELARPADDDLDEFDKNNLSELLVDASDKDKIIREDLTEEGYDSLKDTHNQQHQQIRDSVIEQIYEREPLLKKYKNKRAISKALKDGKIDEDMAIRLRAMDDVRMKVAKLAPQFRRIAEGLSSLRGNTNRPLPLNINHNPKRGSGIGKHAESLVDVLVRSLIGKNREDQGVVKGGWADATNEATTWSNSQAERLKSLRGDESKLAYLQHGRQVQAMFYNKVKEALEDGVLSREEYNDLREDMEFYGDDVVDQQLSDIMQEGGISQPMVEARRRWKSKRDGINEEFVDIEEEEEGPSSLYDIIEALRSYFDLADKKPRNSDSIQALTFEEFRLQ